MTIVIVKSASSMMLLANVEDKSVNLCTSVSFLHDKLRMSFSVNRPQEYISSDV